MKGKNSASVLFGIIFILLGIFMLIIQNGAMLVLVIAIADILFGIVLLASKLFGKGDADPAYVDGRDNDALGSFDGNDNFDDEEEPVARPSSDFRPRKAASVVANSFHDDFDDMPDSRVAAQADEPEDEDEMLRRLSAREFELKTAARRAADDAREAKQRADSAVAAASQAENNLIDAEQQARNLVGAEQQAALRRVDQLANEARELSQQAVIAKKKARTASQNAKLAAEEHSKAMDAAAEAMMAAEERAFNRGNQ